MFSRPQLNQKFYIIYDMTDMKLLIDSVVIWNPKNGNGFSSLCSLCTLYSLAHLKLYLTCLRSL